MKKDTLRIVGSGCTTCKHLYEMVKNMVEKHNVNAEVEYSNDINELIEAGAMGSPGLFKNGDIVLVGMPSDDAQLLKMIKG